MRLQYESDDDSLTIAMSAKEAKELLLEMTETRGRSCPSRVEEGLWDALRILFVNSRTTPLAVDSGYDQ